MGNTPNIRFKGFDDDWEQRKLLEFGLATGGTSIESEFSEDGIYKVISIGSYSEDSVYRDQGIRAVRSDKTVNRILNKGDITMILNDKTASGNIIGRVLLIEESGVYVYNQRTERIEVDNSNYDSQFIYTMLNAPEIRDKIIKQSQGNTQIYVNWTTISQTDYLVPQLSEQRKIGEYFRSLDHLITLHQRKSLHNITQKNPWEQRKLGEMVNVYDGVHQTPEYQDSGVMFLSVENIATLKSEKYISEEAFERDYKVYPEKGDILMTRIGDVGTTNVVETSEKVAFYVSLALLKPNRIDSYFLSNAMKTTQFQKGLRERTLVTAIPQKINKDEIGKVNIFVTNNVDEQYKIGQYFANLDHLITLHRRAYYYKKRRTYK